MTRVFPFVLPLCFEDMHIMQTLRNSNNNNKMRYIHEEAVFLQVWGSYMYITSDGDCEAVE